MVTNELAKMSKRCINIFYPVQGEHDLILFCESGSCFSSSDRCHGLSIDFEICLCDISIVLRFVSLNVLSYPSSNNDNVQFSS